VHAGDGPATVPDAIVAGASLALATDDTVTLGSDGLRLGPWSGAVLVAGGRVGEPGV